jgi:prepilin signal peptidase PulO-like enzyme (type II secretory pathway)
MIIIALILLGLCFGSFINALVWRLHQKRDWVTERSECPHCHHTLAPKDLIPVFSWLTLGGRCRYCHKPIPDSPFVELTVPALFVLSYIYWPQPLEGAGLFTFCLWLVFLIGFVALAVYDFKWFLLPNVIVFPLMALAGFQVLGTMLFFGGSWHDVLGPLFGVAIISGLFLLIYVVSKGAWIGFGDVKLGVVLGILAGGALPALLLLFSASFLGMLVSLPMLVVGKANRKSHLPFGPLLIAGTIVVVLFGTIIIDWYTSLTFGG